MRAPHSGHADVIVPTVWQPGHLSSLGLLPCQSQVLQAALPSAASLMPTWPQSEHSRTSTYLRAGAAGASRAGAAGVVVAAASERRGVRVPRKATRSKIQALAREMTPKDEKAGREHMDKARERLEAGYIAELQETTRSLKSLPQVRLHLGLQAEAEFAGEAGAPLCAALVLHWLAPVCTHCEGRKFRLIGGTDELSKRGMPRTSAIR